MPYSFIFMIDDIDCDSDTDTHTDSDTDSDSLTLILIFNFILVASNDEKFKQTIMNIRKKHLRLYACK